MAGAHEFLTALTIVLGVAGVTTIVFQRLRQPVVLGYILAGLLIGPHVPFPVVANADVVQTLSELGVILLMFGLGLEFSLGKLFRAAPTAGITAVLQCSLMLWLGYLAARLLGWTSMESIYAGAAISISSTTIIAKAFDEQGVRGHLREFVVAILIVEDLVAVLLMAILTGVSSGSGVSASELAVTGARLAVFLVALVVIGMLIVPRLMRAVVSLERAETTIVASIGICFGVSLLVQAFGYSVALGAFIAGMLVAESGEAPRIEPLVHPVRDIFAAVFFVSVGMLIDPGELAKHWLAIVVLTLLVVVGKIAGVSFGAFMTGKGTRTAVAAGMSLAQIGEFSFIIAALGLSLGVIGGHVYSVAVAVSAITTLLTPSLIRRSHRFASFVDRKLPKPLQTFVALYASWVDRMRASRHESRSALRRFARTLLLDVFVIASGLIGVSLTFDTLVSALEDGVRIRHSVARVIVVAAGGALVLPFCVSVLRTTQRFARLLGELAMPRQDRAAVDLGRQPRVVLEAAVRLVGVLIVGSALIAITQPFLPGYTAAVVLLIAITVLAGVFWRTARGLQGHVRAASQAVIEALASQSAAHDAEGGDEDPLAKTHDLFPGLGAPVRFELPATSAAIGRSLADLELRAATGATVLAIVRDGTGNATPDAHDPLRAGDVLAIAGTQEAIAGAIALLEEAQLPAGARP
ncbi:MAG: potassium/proton antiporter rosb [Deltaproteobacteria bacterium]|nr:potassium/proton antiporter rosb [Deltaproteobacteria bacterium]